MNIYSSFKKPAVSLIITCHNLGQYLGECVESIKNQTYEHCEIIIVNDLSDDNTREVMDGLLDVEKIHLEENLGQFGAFLEGLKRAKGEFVCMIDADDVLLPNFVEKHLEAHMRTSVALTSCAQIEIDENSTIHCLNSVASPTFKNDGKVYEEEIKPVKRCSFGTWAWNPSSSAMMRKSALEPLLLYKKPKEWTKGADKVTFSFLHLIGGSALLNTPLMAYRVHSTNLSSANKVMGNKKYLKPQTLKLYISYNKRIRLDILKLIFNNYEYFCDRFNPLSVRRMVWQIVFSFDPNTIKRIFKSLFV